MMMIIQNCLMMINIIVELIHMQKDVRTHHGEKPMVHVQKQIMLIKNTKEKEQKNILVLLTS